MLQNKQDIKENARGADLLNQRNRLCKVNLIGNMLKSSFRSFVFCCFMMLTWTLFVGTTNAIGSNNNNNTALIVEGIASTTVQQNLTSVHLTIQNRAKTASSAQQMTASAATNVLARLNTFNVTDLQTESFTLQAIYNYTDPAVPLLGFVSSESISYKVSSDMAGETLDAVVQSGAVIDSVDNSATEEVVNAAYNQALQNAAKDADTKARLVASALTACLGEPLTITLGTNGNPMPTPTILQMEAVAATSAASGAKPTIVPGKTAVTASVTVVYSQTPCT